MNITPHTKIFIKNIMLGAGRIHLSLTNPDHVVLAVERAYITMQPRTFKKLIPSAKINVVAKNAVLTDLADRFVDFFKSTPPPTQAMFDNWHSSICNWFIDSFNSRVLLPSGYKDIMYGKAQKIINVAFKFLYLFCNITTGSPSHFSFCHFIIDRYTLRWYNDIVCKNLRKKTFKKPWRDMDYNEYIEIQNNIRIYLASQNKYAKETFLAEFEIWSEYAFEQ